MANVVNIQTIIDGPRHTIIKVSGILDTADLGNTTVADPALLVGVDNTGQLKAATFRIVGMNFDVEDGLAVNLYWDAATPVLIDSLVGRGALPPSYQAYGGLTNNAALPGKTGKIIMNTQGWAGILSFNFIVELVKVQAGVNNPIAGTAGPVVNQGYADFAGTIPTR
jgi:hypothetical protein